MSSTKTPFQQAKERFPSQEYPATFLGSTAVTANLNRRVGYAACLEERAIPAEQALRVAMEYINALRSSDAYNQLRIRTAYEANRAKLLAENAALKAELERNKAGWEKAFDLGHDHQDHARKLEGENAALRERLAVLEGQGVEQKPVLGYVYTDDAMPSFIRNEALVFHSRPSRGVERKATVFIANDLHESTPFPLPSASLRAAAQVAADALVRSRDELRQALDYMEDQRVTNDETDGYKDAMTSVDLSTTALTALAEQGVKPTKQ